MNMNRILMLATGLFAFALESSFGAVNDKSLPEISFKGHARIGADFASYQAPTEPWRAQPVRANVFDRCYQPGEPVELAITLSNPGTTALSVEGVWRWHLIGDRPSDELGGIAYVDMGVESEEVLGSTMIPANGEVQLVIKRPAPKDRGVYALVLDDSVSGKKYWITNIASLFPVVSGIREDSQFMGEFRGFRDWQIEMEGPTLEKMGVKWSRVGVLLGGLLPAKDQFNWKSLDERVRIFKQHNILGLFMTYNAPQWMRSTSRIPWKGDAKSHKTDLSPSPEHYGDWAEVMRQVISRYEPTIRGINVWNEPWELGGITDWSGTGLHYRGLHKAAHEGAKTASKGAMVVGNDSDMNIYDNLMCDPDWQSYTDGLTVHSHGGFSGNFIHRLKPEKMPLLNTEMWYSSLSSRTIQWQLMERARGSSQVNLMMLGNFFTAGYKAGGYFDPKDPKNIPDIVPHPNAVAYNAMTYFLEGMQIPEEVDPSHLPYALIFERQKPGAKGADHRFAMVLFGQSIDSADTKFSQNVPGAGATALITPGPEVLSIFDRFGSAIKPQGEGQFRIPFNEEPVYLLSNSREALTSSLKTLQVEKFASPFQLAVIDPTGPMKPGATFSVRVLNPLPHSQSGTLRLQASEGWKIEPAEVAISNLESGVRQEVAVKITEVPAAPGAPLILTMSAESGIGKTSVTDRVESREIPRFTPPVEGGAKAWETAGIPLRVLYTSDTAAESLAAAMPWEAILAAQSDKATGRWAVAYDDEALHVIAELHRPKRGPRPWDQTRDDWFVLHKDGYAYATPPRLPFTGENLQLAIDCRENPEDYLYPKDNPLFRRYSQRTIDYLLGFYETEQGSPQSWLYRKPGSPLSHRYPFSEPAMKAQRVATETKLRVTRIEDEGITRFEVSIPWTLIPEAKRGPGTTLAGLEVKLTPDRWDGLTSSAGRSVSKRDGQVFQPYWVAGFSTASPWGFSPAGK